jgi:quercetin dioxygenase-like cupin family protein
MNESFGTLSETINGLTKLGYTLDFNIHQECLIGHQRNTVLSPEEFQIDKVYRFEGATNPEDQSIVYAISSVKFDVKGTLVNGYGISADETSSKLVEKLQTNNAYHTMENKSNDATPQRPEGNRVFNASLVEMNLHNLIAQLKDEITWTASDRNAITIFKSESMRIVLMGLHKDASLKPHKANGVISVQVLEGKLQFVTEQQTILIEKGQMIALHENITHSVLALKEAFFLITLTMSRKQGV